MKSSPQSLNGQATDFFRRENFAGEMEQMHSTQGQCVNKIHLSFGAETFQLTANLYRC